MKRFWIYILLTVTCISCAVIDEPDLKDWGKDTPVVIDAELAPSCLVSGLDRPFADSPVSMTKALIGTQTRSSFTANFIKVDETSPNSWTDGEQYDRSQTVMPSYTDAQIVEAEFISSADDSELRLRQISFNPRLLYNFTANGMETEIAYASRMVGWHPITYDVPSGAGGSGQNAVAQFREAECMRMMNGKVCVEFKNKLNGQTDLMMTDMREGRMYMPGFRNNERDIDIQPYGHLYDDPLNPSGRLTYCNYFTFKHYLSAIRVFITDGGGASGTMPWGQINNIKVLNQPRTALIALPEVQSRGAGNTAHIPGTTPTLPTEDVIPVFGDVLSWSDYADMDIVRTPMFENGGPDQTYSAVSSLPVEIPKSGSLGTVYAGYMLLKPYEDGDPVVTMRVMTDAGTYDVKIPETAIVNAQEINLLEAGMIYDIYINITDIGELDVVIKNEDADKYNDLSPYNVTYGDYEYSNCYVVTKEKLRMTETKAYDGFYFRPDVPGRGRKGDIGYDHYEAEALFEPVFAKIIYQDNNRPLEHVELVHGFVRFTLNPATTIDNIVSGNAIIAVYDNHDKIIWSWHIWVCDSIDPKTVNGVTVMSKNLGAVYSPESKIDDASTAESQTALLNTYGMYYQWGRKDPTTGPMEWNYDVVDMRTAKYYTIEGIRDFVSEVYMIGNAPQIRHAVELPLTILAPSDISIYYSSDWLFTSNDNLWLDDRKTIYDPCPYGYKVPSATQLNSVFQVFATNSEYGDYGAYDASSKLFFPYTGWKGDDVRRVSRTHAWMKVGEAGDYQTSSINSETKHRKRALITQKAFNVDLFGTNDKNIYNKGYNNTDMTRTGAAVVRCVRYSEEP